MYSHRDYKINNHKSLVLLHFLLRDCYTQHKFSGNLEILEDQHGKELHCCANSSQNKKLPNPNEIHSLKDKLESAIKKPRKCG
jgi:hypothetical protein